MSMFFVKKQTDLRKVYLCVLFMHFRLYLILNLNLNGMVYDFDENTIAMN